MTKDTSKIETKEVAVGGLKMPTPAALAAGAAKRKAAPGNNDKPGRVAGLDYDKFAAAIVDLSELDPAIPKTERRVEGHRRRLEAKGYVRLEGTPIVYGFECAEVWVKTREQWLADRNERTERIQRGINNGMMSDTALIKQRFTGPNGITYA